MKQLAFILTIIAMVITACEKLDIEKGTPKCIEKKISEFNKKSLCSDESVEEYLFQGKTVFVFTDGSCVFDGASEVWDSDCNYLGILTAEWNGAKINGEDFGNATFIKTTWEK